MEAEITISRNRKTRLTVLVSTGFGSFYMLRVFFSKLLVEDFSNIPLLLVLGGFGALMLFFAINSAIELIKNGPAIVVSSAGLEDNISMIKPGLIPWDNISHVSIQKVGGRQQLIVHLADDDLVLNRVSGFRKSLITEVKKKTGGVIAISPDNANFELEELKESLTRIMLAAHQQQVKPDVFS